jgi:hypothetical protein
MLAALSVQRLAWHADVSVLCSLKQMLIIKWFTSDLEDFVACFLTAHLRAASACKAIPAEAAWLCTAETETFLQVQGANIAFCIYKAVWLSTSSG